eukprot:292617_1
MTMLIFAFLFTYVNSHNISLAIYFEACCPYSQNYIVKSLAPAWNKAGFQDIVDILLVPWGNQTYNKSHKTGRYSYQCLHGSNECINQILESCASMYIPYFKFVSFIIELETQMYRNKCQNSTSCCNSMSMGKHIAEKLNTPWQKLQDCVDTLNIADQAEMMSHIMTMQLHPVLTTVPWIVLNGNHNEQIQSSCETSTLECVCDIYQKVYNNTPSVCKHYKSELHPRLDLIDIIIFSILILISLFLVAISLWSIAREKYAIDSEKLKRVRSILFLTTVLQLICFIGYWLQIYLMYELCWIIWVILSTLSIVLLGIRFGESYIKIYSDDYNSIPNIYKYLIYLFWCVGCCVDATGTILGMHFSNQLAQSICYSVWEILCSISIGAVILILKSARDKLKNIPLKASNKKKKKKKKRKKRKLKKRDKISMEAHSENEIDEKKEEYTVKSIKSYGSLKLGDDSMIDNQSSSSKNHSIVLIYAGCIAETTGCTNGNLLLNKKSRMHSEIKRINHLICGLLVSIAVLMVNATFNALHALHIHYDSTFFARTPTWDVAAVLFMEWTVINLIIMRFSWIPRYQLRDDYSSFKLCKSFYLICVENCGCCS